jgi:hypothetical protein
MDPAWRHAKLIAELYQDAMDLISNPRPNPHRLDPGDDRYHAACETLRDDSGAVLSHARASRTIADGGGDPFSVRACPGSATVLARNVRVKVRLALDRAFGDDPMTLPELLPSWAKISWRRVARQHDAG